MYVNSKDAFFKAEGNTFVIGTQKLEKTLELSPCGSFIMKGYLNKVSQEDYVQGGAIVSDEFSITVDGKKVTGSNGNWVLAGMNTSTLSQGELEATITLKNDLLKVERHYVAYPGLAVIQEWTVYENISGKDMKIDRPSLFVQRLLNCSAGDIDFSYMTGGANFTGSCILKTVPVTDGYTKDFDSQGEPEMMEVDGHYGNKCHPRFNGTGIWFEFFALSNRKKKEGYYMTFDYQGWWKAGFTNRDGNTALIGWCELIDYPFAAGASLKIAPMMSGVYFGDLDDLGNTINEYIYTYKWDYTRDKYFNRTNLTIWRAAPLKEKVYKMVEVARYVGIERIWVDDFWFDAKGNWNGVFGDDWKHINDYFKKNGLLFRLWMPPWHADRLSKVWVEHPEWMLDFHGNWYNWTIDMSKEEAYQWILNMLCDMQKKIGTYDLRVDGDPCNVWNDRSFDTEGGNWNGTHKQSENFYRLYKEFKDRNPDAGLDGCSSGGHTLTIESVRYVDQQQITDGECHHMGGYWTTMIMPIDKHQGMPMAGRHRGDWHTYTPDGRYLFSAPGDGMQNPENGYSMEVLEEKRKEYELFYWLRAQGVYGRYIKVYRPEVQHGDKTFILQRMTWDNKKGMIMISMNDLNPILGKPAVIYPKGLNPDEDYLIESLRGGMEPTVRKGKEWMKDGISLSCTLSGEYLLINLPGRPGQGTDKEPPTTPAFAKKEKEVWLDHEGIGISWGESTDNVMVSYYELYKNGEPYTKISTGTYYFDDKGCVDDEYMVRAVDGDGNSSDFVKAK